MYSSKCIISTVIVEAYFLHILIRFLEMAESSNCSAVHSVICLTIHFSKVAHLESSRSEKELLRAIEEDAFSVLSELGAPPPRRIQQSSLKAILSQLERMKNYVDSTVDTRLDFYIEVRDIYTSEGN